MGNRQETRVILGSLRFKTATDTDLSIPFSLSQNEKENVEFDRSVDLSLQQVFDDERQKSENFRPACKFTLLFKNAYSGLTNYTPFENNLYYLNAEAAAQLQCSLGGIPAGAAQVSWTGLPQYNEFDFIRNDYNVSGYTQPPGEHLVFQPSSAACYNWNFYMSYPYLNDYNKQLQIIFSNGTPVTWTASTGIPFVINSDINAGTTYVEFKCGLKHGLTTGEFVKLSFSYNGNDIFQVDSLGDGASGSEEYIFNIINVGYTGTTFNIGQTGTFRRVIYRDNETETISEYYIRKHKILTTEPNSVLTKCGFEQNIFGISKKYESSGLTPNAVARVSIKEGAQSYSLSFNQDIVITSLIDNQKRPLTELFFTVVWKGYFGWTRYLKQGWDFNLPFDPATNLPNSWWDVSNSLSNTSLNESSYTTPLGTQPFYYNTPLTSGDTLDGDFCEWNNYEQKERVISNIYHKFRFNDTQFNMVDGFSPSKFGYYYQPHFPLTIRTFSPYIEEGDAQNIVGVPDYAYFSQIKNLFIWRDLYPYGYIDTDFIGVDYPFLNATHYPYRNIIFRIIPEGTNYVEQTIIAEPITDECE